MCDVLTVRLRDSEINRARPYILKCFFQEYSSVSSKVDPLTTAPLTTDQLYANQLVATCALLN